MKVRPIILAFALPVLVAACASTTDSTKDSGGSAPASSRSRISSWIAPNRAQAAV